VFAGVYNEYIIKKVGSDVDIMIQVRQVRQVRQVSNVRQISHVRLVWKVRWIRQFRQARHHQEGWLKRQHHDSGKTG
jgi:hypothetical protein